MRAVARGADHCYAAGAGRLRYLATQCELKIISGYPPVINDPYLWDCCAGQRGDAGAVCVPVERPPMGEFPCSGGDGSGDDLCGQRQRCRAAWHTRNSILRGLSPLGAEV